MILTDKVLAKLLKERGELVKRGRNLTRKIERLHKEVALLDDERNKLSMKIEQLQDRMVPIVEEKVNPFLKEFEELGNLSLERGVIKVDIINKVDEFKEVYMARKETKDNSNDAKE